MTLLMTSNRAAPVVTAGSTWPLKVSPNKRYIVDGNGVPFYIKGDSSQVLNSIADTDILNYYSVRKSQGFNANWTQMYGDRPGYTAYLHGKPFTGGDKVHTDVSTPNAAYWDHVQWTCDRAKDNGMVVFLGGPGVNGGQGDISDFTQNGTAKCTQFGTFLGNRFKDQGNIIWHIGNDYSAQNAPATDNIILAFADALLAADTGNHPMAIQFVPNPNTSWEKSTAWRSRVIFNDIYTYKPMYDRCKIAYQEQNSKPSYLFETLYEDDGSTTNGRHGYRGTALVLRMEMFWSVLWGANAGYVYGHEGLWGGQTNWRPDWVNSNIAGETARGFAFLERNKAWELVPDFNHTFVTGNYGSFVNGGTAFSFDITQPSVTATVSGVDPTKTTALVYMERQRATPFNFGIMAGPAVARWWNPSTGVYTNAGTFTSAQTLTPPSARDWCLEVKV